MVVGERSKEAGQGFSLWGYREALRGMKPTPGWGEISGVIGGWVSRGTENRDILEGKRGGCSKTYQASGPFTCRTRPGGQMCLTEGSGGEKRAEEVSGGLDCSIPGWSPQAAGCV